MNKKVNVGIIGAGEGASFLMEILKDNHETRIAGIAYRSENRPAIAEAKKRGILLYDDFRKLVESPDIELIINVSGSQEVERYLENDKQSRAQLLPPLGTWIMWRLLEESKTRERETSRNLMEQQVLYSAGVMLASAANTTQTLDLIMESALNIIDMSAGTLALYNEEEGTMQIKASLGFEGKALPMDHEWKLRPGGLTGRILSNNMPTVVEDIDNETEFDTQPLKDIGVRSLIATPLKVTGKIVGILYVDDFKARKVTPREVNILSLLALQAAAAIDKALLLEKAELMAVTDGLTKLYNHRFFTRALEKEIRRCQRYSATMAVLMVDVDHFKNFNDTFGHVQGNVILTTLADILKRSARDTDIVARWGGEEFALILTETPREKAEMVAKRIRKEVEETYFPGADRQPLGKISVSVGVATYPDDSLDSIDIIEKADKSLYRSKEMGRNLVTMYDKKWDMARK
ncbi:MAG: diguanylate cyclase [Nitrospinota bacterium]|nr:diguanylate cyclase [Nitrospinota bacterium]MDH5755934.1 diguanylate cyclase [Nitrospinota bacterium]